MKNKRLILLGLLIIFAVTGFAAKKKFTLVIDAGHGGNDAGAIGPLTKEKIINLNVALAFGRLVENNCPDVKVIYTRKTDVFIPLHTRADIANRNKADLFISIHTNALPRGRISRGLETYTLGMHRAADNLEVAKRENEVILYEKDYKQRYQGFDPNSSESYIMFEFMQDHNMAQSVELAKYVQKRTCASAGRQNKGVKQAGFLVLRETSMPSCLIELGFISTPDEERFLHSSDGVSRLARGIYQAFVDYKKKYDGEITIPLKAEVNNDVNIPTVVPQEEVKDSKQVKKEKKKRKKNKIAQELADAREGKEVPQDAMAQQDAVPNVDVILAQTSPLPVQPVQQQPAQPVQQQPVQPVQQQPVQPVQQQSVQPVQNPIQDVQQPEQSDRKLEQHNAGNTVNQTLPTAQPAKQSNQLLSAPTTRVDELVFKVQIMACDVKLKAKDPRLKGVQNVDFYQERGLYKYTVGASADYNEIARLRKTISASFPQAFVIAFKNGQKINVQEAIKEFKANKK